MIKPGDPVVITKGPIDKVGLQGTVVYLIGNGAMIRLDKDWYTPIQFKHLKKVEKRAKTG
jgi:hypothetical protein